MSGELALLRAEHERVLAENQRLQSDNERLQMTVNALEARASMVVSDKSEPTERSSREWQRLHNEEQLAIQSETIRALGVPILQVWKGILCLPVIGAVDEQRATDMTTELLDRVVQTAAQFAVLDLTGAEFRPETAQYLARMTRTLGLIGGQGVLCGISPRTAKMFVDMHLEFDRVPTYRDLGEALRACLLQLQA